MELKKELKAILDNEANTSSKIMVNINNADDTIQVAYLDEVDTLDASHIVVLSNNEATLLCDGKSIATIKDGYMLTASKLSRLGKDKVKLIYALHVQKYAMVLNSLGSVDGELEELTFDEELRDYVYIGENKNPTLYSGGHVNG